MGRGGGGLMVRGNGLVRNGEEEGREMGWGSWGA